jgi:hypothetical protein
LGSRQRFRKMLGHKEKLLRWFSVAEAWRGGAATAEQMFYAAEQGAGGAGARWRTEWVVVEFRRARRA